MTTPVESSVIVTITVEAAPHESLADAIDKLHRRLALFAVLLPWASPAANDDDEPRGPRGAA